MKLSCWRRPRHPESALEPIYLPSPLVVGWVECVCGGGGGVEKGVRDINVVIKRYFTMLSP